MSAEPIIYLFSVSPDRRWAIVWTPGSGDAMRPLVAFPLNGGDPVRLCENCGIVDGPAGGNHPPMLAWSPDGQYVYLTLQLRTEAQYETGKTYAVRLAKASTLPPAFTDEAMLPRCLAYR